MSGIINYGANCFLNSILQLLSASKNIINKISKESIPNMLCEYGTKDVLDPINVMYYIAHEHRLDMSRQQDADETLGYILDDIKEKELFLLKFEQTTINNKPIKNEETGEVTYEHSESTITLDENILHIEIKGSIEQSILSYFETTEEAVTVEIKNGVTKEYYSPTIKLKPANSPEYLFLALKRFAYVGYFRKKINSEIDACNHFKYNGYIYRPIAFNIHSGESIDGGHYISFKIKDENMLNDKSKPKEYVMVDDTKVYNTTEEQFTKIQAVGYIFLYKRMETVEEFDISSAVVIPAVKEKLLSNIGSYLANSSDHYKTKKEFGWNDEYDEFHTMLERHKEFRERMAHERKVITDDDEDEFMTGMINGDEFILEDDEYENINGDDDELPIVEFSEFDSFNNSVFLGNKQLVETGVTNGKDGFISLLEESKSDSMANQYFNELIQRQNIVKQTGQINQLGQLGQSGTQNLFLSENKLPVPDLSWFSDSLQTGSNTQSLPTNLSWPPDLNNPNTNIQVFDYSKSSIPNSLDQTNTSIIQNSNLFDELEVDIQNEEVDIDRV